MPTLYMRLLFCITFLLGISQLGYSTELDSLHRVLKTAGANDTLRVNIYTELCRIHRSNFPDSALMYGNEALRISRETKYFRGEAIALNFIGKVYFFQDDYEKAQSYQEEAIAFCKKHELVDILANATNSAALAFDYTDNYPKAMDLYFQAMDIEEKLHNTVGVAKITSNLMNMYRKLGDHTKALAYGLHGYELVKELKGNYGLKSSLLNNVGLVYSDKGDYEKALEYYKRALELDELEGNLYNIAIAVGNIGDCLVDLNRLEEAEPYILRHYKLGTELRSAFIESASIADLGWLRLHQGRTDEAIKLLEQSAALKEKSNLHEKAEGTYWQLAKAYMKKGDFRQASKYWEMAYTLNDSLRNDEVVNLITKSQKNYEVSKKQAEVDKLSKEASIQALELSREKNFRIFLLLIVLLLVAVACLAFYGYKTKTNLSNELKVGYDEIKSQKAIIESINFDLQEKAFRAQINPHFIFNCLNSIQYLIANKENNEAFSYLTKFSILLRKILEFSDSAKIDLVEEIELLEIYLKLEALRFDHSFKYQLEYEDIIDKGILIPPLVIQPLAENAIIHGLLRKEGERVLNISFKKENGTIICRVKDNGIGREAARKNRTRSAQHRQSRGVDLSKDRLIVHNHKVDDTVLVTEDLYDDLGNPSGTLVTIKIEHQHTSL